MIKRKTIILISLLWFLLIALSFHLSYTSAVKEREKIALESARSLFDMVRLTYQWNAQHQGVYVPITKEGASNPYLDQLMRDIKVNDSLSLTKVNPAHMIRQIGEIAQQFVGIQIHITSLKPIRPENKASQLEARFLEKFAQGEMEAGVFIKKSEGAEFFYMAPLTVTPSCLGCHAKQGYKLNEIRGGISIILPFSQNVPMETSIAMHLGIGVLGLLGILFAGTRLEHAFQKVSSQAATDSLTAIKNRRSFSTDIVREFDRNRRIKSTLSVIACDIDNFKFLNDNYGHATGDVCLKETAQVIKKLLKRPVDFCARYESEEFIIALPDTDHDGAMQVAEEIRAKIEGVEFFTTENNDKYFITVSLGVSTSIGMKYESCDELINQASVALYRAKQGGRNQVQDFFSSEKT